MKRILLLTLCFCYFNTAQASFLVDPYIGTGLMKTTFDAAGTSNDDDNMSAMGVRAGYQFLLVSAGLDYTRGNAGDYKFTNTSFFVGVDLPILLRVWAEYFISSQLESDSSTFNAVGDIDFKKGSSLGIGFTGLPFVSLNLEIQNIDYESKIGTTAFDFQTAGYLFSVSLPLNF